MRNTPDHLYFVGYPLEPDGSRWVKVGRSQNMAKRMESLGTGTPQVLEVLGIALGCGRHESRVHRELAPWRGKGEWFLLSSAAWRRIQEDIAVRFPTWPALLWEQVESRREEALDRLASEANRERDRDLKREYRKDPDFRERARLAQCAYREDPAFRERKREYHRKYWADPEYRARKREYDKAYRARKKAP